jgi:hypothetical protein
MSATYPSDLKFTSPDTKEMKRLTIVAVLAATMSQTASGQSTTREANCTYEQCALGLKPVWNGLAVTKGEPERKVTVLGFFWPGDVTSAFEGDRDATSAASDAMAVRQIGAILTDAGIVMAVTGISRGLFHRDWDKLSTALTIAGGTALGVSVPFQFAADGYLSRAVWLFNRKYAK